MVGTALEALQAPQRWQLRLAMGCLQLLKCSLAAPMVSPWPGRPMGPAPGPRPRPMERAEPGLLPAWSLTTSWCHEAYNQSPKRGKEVMRVLRDDCCFVLQASPKLPPCPTATSSTTVRGLVWTTESGRYITRQYLTPQHGLEGISAESLMLRAGGPMQASLLGRPASTLRQTGDVCLLWGVGVRSS